MGQTTFLETSENAVLLTWNSGLLMTKSNLNRNIQIFAFIFVSGNETADCMVLCEETAP